MMLFIIHFPVPFNRKNLQITPTLMFFFSLSRRASGAGFSSRK